MKTKILWEKLSFICVLSFFGIAFAQTNLLNSSIILNSENQVTLEASLFEEISTGFYLTITYKNVKAEDHFVNLYGGEKSPLTYGALRGASAVKNTFYPDKASGKFSYVLVSRDVSAIKKNGIIIKGQGLKITNVVCEPAPVSKKKDKGYKS